MENDRIYTLLARKMAGELLPGEEAELEALLQQHPYASYIREVLAQSWSNRHRQYSPEEITALLDRHTQRLQQVMATTPEAEETPVTVMRPRWRLVLRYAGVAAAITLLALAGRKWWINAGTTHNEPAAGQEHLLTQKGARSKILLPDGSTVWLNAGSRLDYPKQFSLNSREVTLEGEAFFVVTKDASRPFKVKTRAFNIRVLGTSFNVRAYPQEDSAVTALVQGSVEVVLSGKAEQVIPLKPNEKLTVPMHQEIQQDQAPINSNNTTTAIYKGKLTEVKDSVMAETAWVQNKLAFKHLPLEKVVALMEQWYGADIRFKNESRKQLIFSGVFEKESLEQALDALELTTFSFRYSKDANGTIWIE